MYSFLEWQGLNYNYINYINYTFKILLINLKLLEMEAVLHRKFSGTAGFKKRQIMTGLLSKTVNATAYSSAQDNPCPLNRI